MRLATFWCVVVGAMAWAMPNAPAEDIQPRLRFKAHAGSAMKAIISPDERLLITLGGEYLGDDGKLVGDNQIKAWDFASGKPRDFPQLTGLSIAMSPDGKLLAVVDEHEIRLLEVDGGKTAATFKDEELRFRAVAFSPDGKTLALGGNKEARTVAGVAGVVQMRELATGKIVATLEPNRGPLKDLAFSPDGRLLAVATQTFPSIGDVRFWDVATGQLQATLEAGGVDCVAFSPDGKTLAAGCGGRRDRRLKDPSHHVRLWDVGASANLRFIKHEFRVLCVAFSPDGKTVAAGSELGELALWNATTGELRFSVPNQPPYVHSLVFSKNGQTLVSTNRRGEVCYWDVPALLQGNADK